MTNKQRDLEWYFTPNEKFELDLGNQEILGAFIVFSVVFILVGIVSKFSFPLSGHGKMTYKKSDGKAKVFEDEICKENFEQTKKLSWCISLFNSLVTFIFGTWYLYHNAVNRHQNFFLYGPELEDVFYVVAPIEIYICIFFGLACFYDLLFGIVFYPAFVQSLTGYFHHSLFIWMMILSCTGNGGFLNARPFASAFVYMLIEELPTFILALGSIVPSLRTDIGFGVTFFMLRICYHSYIVSFAFLKGFQIQGMILYYITLVMHINWFYGWCKVYFKPQKKKET
jgi:hypothetical protein